MLNMCNLQHLNTLSPVSDYQSIWSVTFLTQMPSSLWRDTGTQFTLFIMFCFSDLEGGLLFMLVLGVAMFKEVFYGTNKKI